MWDGLNSGGMLDERHRFNFRRFGDVTDATCDLSIGQAYGPSLVHSEATDRLSTLRLRPPRQLQRYMKCLPGLLERIV